LAITKKDLKKLAKQSNDTTEKVWFNIGDEVITLEVRKTISLLERAQFVEEVVSAVFVDEIEVITGEDGAQEEQVISPASIYIPINREHAWNIYLLHHFAGCPLDDQKDADVLSTVADNYGIMEKVQFAINSHMIAQLQRAVDDAISFRQMQLTAYAANELAKLNANMAIGMEYIQSDDFKGQIKKLNKDVQKTAKIASELNIVK